MNWTGHGETEVYILHPLLSFIKDLNKVPKLIDYVISRNHIKLPLTLFLS